jgi:CRISPR-associated protein Csm1
MNDIHHIVLGALLHDIGKFMQRAHTTENELPPLSRNMESVLCPTHDGRYTHRHILWTDAFFEWMGQNRLAFPRGIDLARVRDFANFHHRPDSHNTDQVMGWISAEADRLSSGMDRKPRQEEFETQRKGWENYKRMPLQSIFSNIQLPGRGKAPQVYHVLAPLAPEEEGLFPTRELDSLQENLPEQYEKMWQLFCEDFKILAGEERLVTLFVEGLLGLLERYTWAVPSSTMDLPDISLYDHARTTAAIAACLYLYHSKNDAWSVEAVKDRRIPKFRILGGDLSGIQKSLFQLRTEGVRGANKILRARSFFLSAIPEAASWLLLTELGLPSVCRIQSAGGGFRLLVPEREGFDDALQELQYRIDNWLRQRYMGEVAFNLVPSEPFPAQQFMEQGENGLGAVFDEVSRRLEIKKMKSFEGVGTAVLRGDYAHGVCVTCGIRPGIKEKAGDWRCVACDEELWIGGKLPGAIYLSWRIGRSDPSQTTLFERIKFDIHTDPLSDEVSPDILRIERLSDKGSPVYPRRWLANYVPRFSEKDINENRDRYEQVVDKEDRGDERAGAVKTLAHLAAEALEMDSQGGWIGKPFLAALKADADNMGVVFSRGLHGNESLSRFVSLSRMLDFFFSGYLIQCLETNFQDTYTVFAGGDDLLLLGPWREMLDLARAVNREFRRFTGENPSLTLSAGVELMAQNHPVYRTVTAAEEGLEAAKHTGRDRVRVLGEVLPWSDFDLSAEEAEKYNREIRDGRMSAGLAYRLLKYGQMASEVQNDPRKATWRALLAYDMARNVKGKDKEETRRRQDDLLNNVGLSGDLRGDAGRLKQIKVPLQWALYRNRH